MNVNALTAVLRVDALGLDARKALSATQISPPSRDGAFATNPSKP